MKIFGIDGQSFELKILRYEFPEEEIADYDSNWLIIEINVNHPKGAWVSSHPSLLTYEVSSLADWLENIDKGEIVDPEECFIEHNLRFQLTNTNPKDKKLRIYFELESRPKWASVDDDRWGEIWVEFQIAEIQLNKAVNELRKQLKTFPQRAKV